MVQLENITKGFGYREFALFSKIVLQKLKKRRLFVVNKILTEASG